MSSFILPNGKIDDIKMVLFDKDGTLIDVHHYWCSMIEFRAEFFIDALENEDIDLKALYDDLVNNMGIDLRTKKMKAEGPVGIKPRAFIVDIALKTINKYVPNYSKEQVLNVFAKVDEYSKIKLKDIVKPLIGIKTLLHSLKSNGIIIAIATTDLSTRARLAMKDLDFEHYFDKIAGADLVENAKPSTDLVDYINRTYKMSSQNILVVGDSMSDLKMAENAKCKFLGVKTGLYTEDFLNKSEYLVENLNYVKVK